ncbi:YtxH domain-containing protein [Virgibacillus sp. NKC19-16]|uniref:YtxH domain-containing protein n=1 Tax=Virgibacillus salidurans TaxID=2831673 RepID=UPI001F213F74|nr:YtxH domain-containing protein [Virgibacillus sp. NKC19-16]UJL47294.1 YtxH domain-containing protein [Virgibacillus sp. NKC19-16]
MSKRKLFLGVVTGAVVGGLVTLFDRETRHYAKNKLTTVKSGTTYMVKNPSETVHNMRVALNKLNDNLSSGSSNLMNALEQVEGSLEKVSTKSESKKELE